MVLYYQSSDSRTNEKKLTSNLQDCLLILYNRINHMRSIDPNEDKGSSGYERPQLNFSQFYSNCYLFFHIKRFLLEKNLINMSQMFGNAAIQELACSLSEMNKKELASLRSMDYSLLWKLISSREELAKLQSAVFRYMMLSSPKTTGETICLLSFFTKRYLVEENFNPHLDQIYEFFTATQPIQQPNQNKEKETVDFFLRVVIQKNYESYIDQSEGFQEYIQSRLAAESIGVHEKPSPKSTPQSYFGIFFPENDLAGMPTRYEEIERNYFEEYINHPLKNWIDSVKEKSTVYYINPREPQDVRNLLDDFSAIVNANIQRLGERVGEESYLQGSAVSKIPMKTAMDAKSEQISLHSIREFDEFVKKTKSVRVFAPSEVTIMSPEPTGPDYLTHERIQVFQGCLEANQQRCHVFKVTIRYIEHLKRIRENLDLMNMYSPLVVQYLG